MTDTASRPADAAPARPPDLPRYALPQEGKFWLVATAVAAVTGWFKTINLILLLSYLMLTLWGLNLLTARAAVRFVTARRRPVGPLFAGTTANLEVEVTNPSPRAAVGCSVVDEGPGHRAAWLLPRLAPGETRRLRRAVAFPARGPYAGWPLRAEGRFPFGLVTVTRELGPALDVVVLPRLGTVHADRLRHWLTRSARGDGRSHRLRRPTRAQDADLQGLRTFRFGDSPRWIHWRTSARRNELMVRECGEPVEEKLVVVLEPWRPEDAELPDASLEAAVSLAATVCWEWCRHPGEPLALVVGGPDGGAVTGLGGPALANRMLERLAVEPGGPDSDPAALAAKVRKSETAAPVLFISSRPDSPLAEDLGRRLGRPVAAATAESLKGIYEPPVGQ